MDLYPHNIQALSKRFPAIHAQVIGGGNDCVVKLKTSQTQYPTALVQTKDGYSALHHLEDPIEYCQQLLRSIPEINAKHNIILFGCGLGYLPLLVHQTYKNFRNLVILEPSISVFRQALMTIDLQSLINDKRVKFIVGAANQNVYQNVLPLVVEFMANAPLMINQAPVTSTFPQWTEEAKKQIQAVIQLGRSGLATKIKDGPLTLSNLFKNIEVIQSTHGLKPFRYQLKDVPAVIVAAGPSLSKNIDQLKTVQDHVLIVATDTALETCLHHGVTPHFVVTVDPTELNLRHFTSSRYDQNITLLFDPEARPEIPDKFSSVLTYNTDKHDFFRWLDQQTGRKGIIKKGGMVSQAGIYASYYFGCNPIILIGQDLALEPKTGATHTSLASNVRKASFDPNDKEYVQVSTIEDQNQNTKEQLFWVEGINGKPVPTMHNFMVYIHMLAEDIKQLSATIIDATEGGAKIPGTKITTLNKALQNYVDKENWVTKRIRDIRDHLPSLTDHNYTIKADLKELLSSRLDKVKKGKELLSKAGGMSLLALERKLDEYRTGFMSNPAAEYLIEFGAPQELFAYLKLPPANAGDEEKRQHIIQRFESLFNAVETASERLLNQL